MKNKMISVACLLLLAAQPAIGADAPSVQGTPSHSSRPTLPEHSLENAAAAVKRMKADPHVREMLSRAKGIFIMPAYSRKSLTTGDQDTPGILLVREKSGWSNPIFYHVGPIVVGAHAGAGINAMAALLISDEAVRRFTQGGRFTVSPDHGFNMANHSSRSGPFPDEGDDVMMWSDAAGIFPGAAMRLEDILPDERSNQRLYGTRATVQELLADKGGAGGAQAQKLREALKR